MKRKLRRWVSLAGLQNQPPPPPGFAAKQLSPTQWVLTDRKPLFDWVGQGAAMFRGRMWVNDAAYDTAEAAGRQMPLSRQEMRVICQRYNAGERFQ